MLEIIYITVAIIVFILLMLNYLFFIDEDLVLTDNPFITIFAGIFIAFGWFVSIPIYILFCIGRWMKNIHNEFR